VSEAPDSAAPAIRVSDLAFSYSSGRSGQSRAFHLHLPSWQVAQGARVALHGPSGCGKSTLLNLLAGVLRPVSGRIEVAGRAIGELGDTERRAHRIRHLGLVFQDFPLVEYLDISDNVLLPFRLNPALRLDDEARRRAATMLTDLGLGGRGGERVGELSIGERQRVAVARALVTEPEILLADEPTAGLDPQNSLAVVKLLEGLCSERGLTLLMVTHDPSLLARFDEVLEVSRLSSAEPAEAAGAAGAAGAESAA
jgi:putative ABC transport system ATP-binding protein